MRIATKQIVEQALTALPWRRRQFEDLRAAGYEAVLLQSRAPHAIVAAGSEGAMMAYAARDADDPYMLLYPFDGSQQSGEAR